MPTAKKLMEVAIPIDPMQDNRLQMFIDKYSDQHCRGVKAGKVTPFLSAGWACIQRIEKPRNTKTFLAPLSVS